MKKSTWINIGIVAAVAIVVIVGLTHMKNKTATNT